MATYTLQTDDIAAGRMTVKLHTSLTGLTVPSYSSVWYSKTNERYDAIPGTIEFDEMEVKVFEDYSTYSEGFWYKVSSNGDGELQFILDDGYGDAHYFWGKITGPVSVYEELSYINGQYEREGNLKLVSILSAVKGGTVGGMLTEIENHLVEEAGWPSPAGNNEYSYYHSIKCLFASILVEVFGQTYDENDVIIPAIDLKFYKPAAGGEVTGLENIFLYYGEGIGGAPGFSLRDGFPWTAYYRNTYEVMNDVANSLFLHVRHNYDVSTSRHQFVLLTRGRSYSANTYDTPISSELMQEAYPPLQSIRSARKYGTGEEDMRWIMIQDGAEVPSTADIPSLVQIDRQVTYLFPLRVSEEAWSSSLRTVYFFVLYLGAYTQFGDSRFYDYTGGAHADQDYLVAKYYLRRYKQSKRAYRRVYPSLKANDGSTNTHANNYALRTTTINDGVTDRTYYAVEVEKDVYNNECTILWHEK